MGSLTHSLHSTQGSVYALYSAAPLIISCRLILFLFILSLAFCLYASYFAGSILRRSLYWRLNSARPIGVRLHFPAGQYCVCPCCECSVADTLDSARNKTRDSAVPPGEQHYPYTALASVKPKYLHRSPRGVNQNTPVRYP